MSSAELAIPCLMLLPGLDGTGDLFRPLLGVIPPNVPRRVISYPVDRAFSYDGLFDVLDRQLADQREMVLVAESFSGPLALRFAAMHPQRVWAVVLCASFIRSPVPRWLRCFANSFLFHLPLPAFALRHVLVGRGATAELVQAVKQSIQKVPPQVLAGRLNDVFNVDCSEALQRCSVPILCLSAAHDALVRQSSLKAIQAIRQVEARTIEGPHLLLQAEPEACWREIDAFLISSGPKGWLYDRSAAQAS